MAINKIDTNKRYFFFLETEATEDSEKHVRRGCILNSKIECGKNGVKCCETDRCNNANMVSISKITLVCLILSWAITFVFVDFH